MDIAYSFLNRILNGQRGLGAKAIAGFRLAGIEWDEVVEVVENR